MVNNLVFRWPKPLFFMVLGAHGTFTIKIYQILGKYTIHCVFGVCLVLGYCLFSECQAPSEFLFLKSDILFNSSFPIVIGRGNIPSKRLSDLQ